MTGSGRQRTGMPGPGIADSQRELPHRLPYQPPARVQDENWPAESLTYHPEEPVIQGHD